MAKQRANYAQSKFRPIDSRGTFVVQGTRLSTTSTTFVLVPGCVMDYTSGPHAEKLFLTLTAMSHNLTSGQVVELTLGFDGIPLTDQSEIYAEGTLWSRGAVTCTYDLPANDTVTIRVYAKVSGGTGEVTNDAEKWMPRVTGFGVGV